MDAGEEEKSHLREHRARGDIRGAAESRDHRGMGGVSDDDHRRDKADGVAANAPSTKGQQREGADHVGNALARSVLFCCVCGWC